MNVSSVVLLAEPTSKQSHLESVHRTDTLAAGAQELAQLVHCAVLPPSCCGRRRHQRKNKAANKFQKNLAGNPLGKFGTLKTDPQESIQVCFMSSCNK